jgi:hypothetical protein
MVRAVKHADDEAPAPIGLGAPMDGVRAVKHSCGLFVLFTAKFSREDTRNGQLLVWGSYVLVCEVPEGVNAKNPRTPYSLQ